MGRIAEPCERGSIGVQRQRMTAQFGVASEEPSVGLLGNGQQQCIERIVVRHWRFEFTGGEIGRQVDTGDIDGAKTVKNAGRICIAFTLAGDKARIPLDPKFPD